jgi:hypothetical protein
LLNLHDLAGRETDNAAAGRSWQEQSWVPRVQPSPTGARELAAAIVRFHNDHVTYAHTVEAGQSLIAAAFSETQVDALMAQALAPVLCNWNDKRNKSGHL